MAYPAPAPTTDVENFLPNGTEIPGMMWLGCEGLLDAAVAIQESEQVRWPALEFFMIEGLDQQFYRRSSKAAHTGYASYLRR